MKHSFSNKRILVVLVGLIVIALIPVVVILQHGISAREEPTRVEVVIARMLRHFAVPAKLRNAKNPIPLTPDALAEASRHFADHCAQCHGNDGRGKTEMGKNLYPKAPDMTIAETQNLSDGELFAIIRNGVRLTGMPAWGGDGDDADDWKLVHFIRHMPKMSKEEIHAMRRFNPISRADLEEEEFLNGKQ
jgi:mono/diheme cytochrome c family protein